ncbi:MAG TPA: sigma factor-like helix-turn-helix DNA-binding protein [Methyloceanibacter sp.]|nr:sigma factor-like helix-turn-helix DNA-binding protein [Methyloceanibacter sp.]
MWSNIHDESVRYELIAMLPRLKRFADVLVGEKKEGRALLRRALLRMLNDQHRYQRGTLFDRWAFAEIYWVWLGDLRHQADPLHQAKAREKDFEGLFTNEGAEFDALTANFLGQLPPRQRGALLLVYGEGFDYEDAGRVLDSTPDTIRSRLIRTTASLADRLSSRRAGIDQGKIHRDIRFQETAG